MRLEFFRNFGRQQSINLLFFPYNPALHFSFFCVYSTEFFFFFLIVSGIKSKAVDLSRTESEQRKTNGETSKSPGPANATIF